MALNNWTQESKARLSEKVQGNITDMSLLVKQMIKNSKSGDVGLSLLSWQEFSLLHHNKSE